MFALKVETLVQKYFHRQDISRILILMCYNMHKILMDSESVKALTKVLSRKTHYYEHMNSIDVKIGEA